MLTGESRGVELCQTFQDFCGPGGVSEVVHGLPHRFAGREDFRFGDGWGDGTRLSEKIAAEQRAGRLVEQDTAIPPMRHMRRVNPLPCLLPRGKRLAISQTSPFPVGMIVERCHHADMAGEGSRLWSHG